MKVFGHRGAAGHFPENTLPSIRAALSMGVDGVEFDVRVTRDGIPVVLHDASIDRTTSALGRLRDFSAQQLRQLLPDELESIPLLAEVLAEIGNRSHINVELKEAEACQPTLECLQASVESGIIQPEKVLVSSFDLDAVRQFCEMTSRFAVGLLTKHVPKDSFWELAETLGAASANISLESVNEEFVATAHRKALDVMVFTVNTLSDADRMQRLGVDAIFSDFPDRVGA